MTLPDRRRVSRLLERIQSIYATAEMALAAPSTGLVVGLQEVVTICKAAVADMDRSLIPVEKPLLSWAQAGQISGEEALLRGEDSSAADFVLFTLDGSAFKSNRQLLRGDWVLRITISRAPQQVGEWPKLKADEHPVRYFHSAEAAKQEAEAIARGMQERRYPTPTEEDGYEESYAEIMAREEGFEEDPAE